MVKNFFLFLNLILLFCNNIHSEIFTTERIEELKKIIADNSGQKILMTYSEYKEAIKSNLHTNNIVIKKYVEKVDSLIEKIKYFIPFKMLSKPIAEETIMKKIDEEKIKNWATNKTNIKVINCKLFMIELYTDNAEGTFLNLDSFIENGEEKPFQWLKTIFGNSKEQNEEIDVLVNLAMISAHIQNKNIVEAKRLAGMKEKQIEKVLIEGGGPNGLYAAIEFFMSGMSITLVNDRIGYTRVRTIGVFGRWIVRILFFVSTRDRAYDVKNLNLKGKPFHIKDLEMMMKERLESLMAFIKKWDLLSRSELVLLYETEVKEIKYSDDSGHYANLGAPRKSKNYQNLLKSKMEEMFISLSLNDFRRNPFNVLEIRKKEEAEKWIHNEKMTNIRRLLEIKYGREIKENEEIISKGNGKISPNKLAKLEMNENGGEKWMEFREYPEIQFDLLLCAGGINDRIKNNLLGVQTLTEEARKHATTTFIRNIFLHEFNKEIAYFVDSELDEISLREQKINEFLKSCDVLPKEFKEKYKNLNEMLRKNSIKSFIRIGEVSTEFLELTPEITRAFVEFLEEIEEIKTKDVANAEKIQKFRNGILRKWFAAIFYTLLKMDKVKIDQTAQLNMDKNGEPGEKFDPNKINFVQFDLSVFDVSILTSEMPVKLFLNGKEEISKQFAINSSSKITPKTLIGSSTSSEMSNSVKHSAIVAAIGDANANMDFLKAEAVSISRLGTENVAKFVRKYNQREEQIDAEVDLVKLIYKELKRWQEKSYETSMEISKIIRINVETIRKKNRAKAMKALISK